MILDQATRLRELAAAYRSKAAVTPQQKQTKVIAVISGKGGVGKTNLSVSLAHALLAAGKDVILLDADLGLANAEILLGTVPPYHLGHLLAGDRGILEIIHRTPSNLRLIAGGAGLGDLANLPTAKLHLFIEALGRLQGEADYLILDTGAGLSSSVQEFVLVADLVLLVTTPEPTALADGYAALKAISRRNRHLSVRLVINQAEREEEARLAAERIILTARDFLGVTVEHVGTVPRDPYVWQAVRSQVPFFVGYPGAPASLAVEAMARRLLGKESPTPLSEPRPGFFDQIAGLFGRREPSRP